MKKVVASAILSASLLLSVAPVSFASEVPSVSFSSQDLDKISEHLNDLGLSKEVQQSLIEKMKAGELPDSDNPEKRGTGITSEVESPDGLKIQRTTFPDGSVIQSTIDLTNAKIKEEHVITPNDVSGGYASGGSGYRTFTNATVREETSYVKARFFADYTLVQGGYSYISDAYDPYIDIMAGYSSGENLVVDQPKQTDSRPARATLSFTWVKVNGYFSSTYKLFLYVNNSSATSQLQTY
ncbi:MULTISPECIES: hypothetical protein [Paenibacillus]|uniref:hypothetical protein n=1 Tax=Paenibacillus TaxID=44249 RepID=UPI000F7169A6|nr:MULTISPECIES: hypothetical protein [Paenibacillus]AZH28460.1 hypothetical protein EGM68_06620 [Paenibacillus sp. M-152]TKH38789.1 hypothetical protein C1I59_05830 [Paenibacillus polymyxa]